MLIKFTYRNHKGQEFRFGDGCVLANRHDFFDYSWNCTMTGSRVGKLERSTGTHAVPLIFVSPSSETVYRAIDDLVDIAEADTSAGKSGKLIVNGYTLKCFITGVKHGDWLPGEGYCEVSLTIQPDGGVWTKELFTQPFNGSSSVILDGEGEQQNVNTKKYSYRYPIQYADGNERKRITVSSVCKARFSIYGPCVNPEITVGSTTYRFSIGLLNGERLVLDQTQKTIEKIASDGSKSSAFSAWADMDSDLFAPIQAGENTVSWSGFSFYLTPIEERSAPRWL